MTKPKSPPQRRPLHFVTADGELMIYAPSRHEQQWSLERLIAALERGQYLQQPLPYAAHDQILQHLLDLRRRLTKRRGGRPAHKSLTKREQTKHFFRQAAQRTAMEREIARVMREDKLRRLAAIKRLAKRSSIDRSPFSRGCTGNPAFRVPRFRSGSHKLFGVIASLPGARGQQSRIASKLGCGLA